MAARPGGPAGLAPPGLVHSVRAAGVLWWRGVQDASRFHRCVVYYVHDPTILAKTGQCVLLNGAVLLGSLLAWRRALAPALDAVLASAAPGAPAAVARAALPSLFAAAWVLPANAVALVLSAGWYADVARAAVGVRAGLGAAPPEARPRTARPPSEAGGGGGDGGAASAGPADDVYRAALFAAIFAEASLVGLLPVVGRVAGTALTWLLYGLYCFDYPWGLARAPIAARLAKFEASWPYYAGFGAVACTPAVLLPFLEGGAAVAALYPLFVVLAVDADPDSRRAAVAAREAAAGRALARGALPVFRPAVAAATAVTAGAPRALERVLRRRRLAA